MKQLVIMPGGFHPFHAGHAALYQSAIEAFPGADVYVAATNDTSTRPFPFAVKEKLAQLAGVSKGRFMQVKSPFRAEEITHKYDPNNTQLIFVRSEKDAGSPPRPGGTKKDGTPSYLQPYNDASDQPLSQHAYMAYLPTVEFGPGMTSATQIRSAWPSLDERRKTALVMSLYPKTQTSPKLAQTVVKLLDAAIVGQDIAEGSEPQVGDAVYYGKRLVGWFKGYSEHGKIITEPNYEEMGDEYANRDVYWDPQDKITIKPEQGVTETINPDILNPKFKHEQRIGKFLYTATTEQGRQLVEPYPGAPGKPPYTVYWLRIKSFDGDRQIGFATFQLHGKGSKQWLESFKTEVNGPYRSQGVASTMYAYAKMLGNDIKPSPTQDPDGKAMWAAWRKSGASKQLRGDANRIDTQGVSETINPSVRNKRFVHTQVIGDYTYKASVEWFIGSPLLYIKAYDGDKQIGEVMFEIITRSPGGKRDPSADYLESGGTEVEPEYRNKGVASTMYAYAKMLGNDIVPSDNQRPDGKAMWAAWEKSGDAKHLIGTAAESTIAEGPIVSRIVHPRKINIYVRSGINKPPVLVATDIPYEILDRYIAKVISKYPRFKATDFSFKPSDKVSENQGWAATYEALKPDAFNALQQAKQRIEQDRQQEISQWEQDFRANTAARFAPRSRPAAPVPAPVAQPGEKHAVLKARISQLDQAIKKQQQLDALSQKLEYKGLLTPAMQQDLDTRMYVRDAAADNYQALNQKLDRAIEIATTRLRTNKLAFRENADYIEEANKQ
jgi:GNAT superfamily N-acetyltransferase